MDDHDRWIRNLVYRRFIELGRAPTLAELTDDLGGDAEPALQRLHEAHALVLNPATDEIRMANPFSAVPTAYRVHGGGRWWYANCAWDAFGVLSALVVDGRIESSCPDCGESYAVAVTGRRVVDRSDLLFHCLVPAAHWWDDIVFT